MTSSNNRVPDWILERVAQGELPKSRLEGDPTAAERLAELERSNVALRAELPPLRRIQQRAESARPRREWRIPVLVPSLAVAALAAFIVFRGDGQGQGAGGTPGQGEEVTRIKGDTRLLLHRKRGATFDLLASGAAARAGEVVQISWLAEPGTYGVIVSIDGRGAVTLHHPESARGSTELGAKGAVPSAYQLDDAPGFERFVLVTSKEPLQVERVLEAARSVAADPSRAREAPLPIPAGQLQSSMIVRKTP